MPSVFLSHSSKDKAFAQRLAGALTKHGIVVWIDEAELRIGDSLIKKISEAIQKTDYVIAVLSANSVCSRWVQKELELAMTREIQDRRLSVLPVLIERCELPSYLTDKLYADFTDPENFQYALSRLVSTVTEQATEPPAATVKLFRVDDHFWNPRGWPKATGMHHALALRDISVSITQDPEYDTFVHCDLMCRVVSQQYLSVGYDFAPWLHLLFLDRNAHILAIDTGKQWAVMEFTGNEDRKVSFAKRIYCPHFLEISGVKTELSAGYPGGPLTMKGQRVTVIARGRALVGRIRRRLTGA